MKTNTLMKYVSVLTVVSAFGMFAYVVHASKATSYLSEDPKVCINCHTMNTPYATWQHSSHRGKASCVDCHLPRESLVDKILAKSRDGFNHSYAMTFRTYEGRNIRASEDARQRIQANCISCHREIVSEITAMDELYRTGGSGGVERVCWTCHRDVPHGRVRGLTATPDNIGIKEI
ncbi:MAG TPA: cytochrome c nitrite reductase small subunit [Desulfobacteraceae bacterium]|nr:cytochrome c nitrite reductase small subunit [Desulfobacteraceae bacterium]